MVHIHSDSAPILDKPAVPREKPHTKFFFQNDFVVLKVEATLFNIPTFILSKHSSKFETLLLSRALTSSPETITLENTKAIDFERLLTLLFPSIPGQLGLSTVEEWASVLAVSHNWEFTAIKELAISQLQYIASAVDMAVLGRKYDLLRWSIASSIHLCLRAEPISKDEGHRLGLDAVIDISAIRYHLRSNQEVYDEPTMQKRFSQSRSVLDGNPVAPYLDFWFSRPGQAVKTDGNDRKSISKTTSMKEPPQTMEGGQQSRILGFISQTQEASPWSVDEPKPLKPTRPLSVAVKLPVTPKLIEERPGSSVSDCNCGPEPDADILVRKRNNLPAWLQPQLQ